MEKKELMLKRLRTVISLILVGMYVIGLIAMMTFSFQAGLILWVVSTLGGIGLLYYVRTMEKRREDAEKATANADAPEEGGE